jgi:hypothetical protein
MTAWQGQVPASEYQDFQPAVRMRSPARSVLLTILLLGGVAATAHYQLYKNFRTSLATRDRMLLELQSTNDSLAERESVTRRRAKSAVAECQDQMQRLSLERARLNTNTHGAPVNASRAAVVAPGRTLDKPLISPKKEIGNEPLEGLPQ